MIANKSYKCQHGIHYDEETEYCFYMDCKHERRLKNKNCPDCQIHSHGNFFCTFRQSQHKFSSFTQGKMGDLEFHVLYQKIDYDFLKKQIEYSKSLVENVTYLEIIAESLMLKCLQISQLLEQIQQPILNHEILVFRQLIKNLQENTKFNQITTTNSYQITKVHNVQLNKLSFIALSPNEKLLIIGIEKSVYLYDIQTNLNKKIYKLKEFVYQGQFCNNSNKIILVSRKGILQIDLKSNKTQYIKIKLQASVFHIFICENLLYIILISEQQKYAKRLIKFDLKSYRQIYSYNLGDCDEQVYLLKDLIAYQYQLQQVIINDSTRKTEIQINLNQYSINKTIFLNQNEMLCLQNDRKIIIWNIDYQNNSLIKQKLIPFQGIDPITDIFIGNPSQGYIYIILDENLQIVDENQKSIYICHSYMSDINQILRWNSKQFNSNKTFITFQIDWICLLKMHDM